MVEDGPFFSNTKQFYKLYNMSQTQSYKLRVMARIDRGFFTANKIWTCYRRNYFQVSTAYSILGFDHNQESDTPCLIELHDSGSLGAQGGDPNNMIGSLDSLRLNDHQNGVSTPGGMTGGPSRLAVVTNFSISITSKIASTDKKIDLIQHTPKRDKGPQIVPGLRSIRGGGTLTLTSATATSPPTSSSTLHRHHQQQQQSVVTFERVQFKTATANNGKRRAAQQFYILMVDLYAHMEDGQVVMVASSQSDSLVVRGRSPGHYVDLPERDGLIVTSPTMGGGERRMSNISQHSTHGSHPYNHYSGTHSRSQSISAGAGVSATGLGMSVDVSSLSLGGSGFSHEGGGPLSPLSPGVAGSEYSPTTGPTPPSFYRYPSHQGWATDASSMSSPSSSTYEGSAFSSPTTLHHPHTYHHGHQQGQPSPQEHGHTSYFAPQQRQPSFGSMTPHLMLGPGATPTTDTSTTGTGLSPRHPFDGQQLGSPLQESAFEQENGGYYQQQQHSHAGYNGSSTAVKGHHPHRHAINGVNGTIPGHNTFIKTEIQDGYFPYSGAAAFEQQHQQPPHPLSEAGVVGGVLTSTAEQTPSSTTASSVASSFGYPAHDLGGGSGMEGQGHGQGYDSSPYRNNPAVVYGLQQHQQTYGDVPNVSMYQQQGQEHPRAVAWS
ncbi:hypothetical protein EDD11_001429 [Mortierella claussenii]|nr:hypothetical protein EDD11_001429 [Mortierella claussenii]